MSDQKFNEAWARAKQKLAEEAKLPRPKASTFADVQAFVDKSRSVVQPGVEYYKSTDTTLIVLQNLEGKKLEVDGGLLPKLLEEAGRGNETARARSVLINAQAALAGYADSIERARTGGASPQVRSLGHLKVA
jgi:hypothetical protein